MSKKIEERLIEFEKFGEIFGQLSKKDKIILFQHIYNPEHMYCRLRDLNIKKDYAKEIMKIYEEEVYNLIKKSFNRTNGKNSTI